MYAKVFNLLWNHNSLENVFVAFFPFKDTFFYSLVYDPSLKTLLADKGEIRVGPRYQADVPEMLCEGKNLILVWATSLYSNTFSLVKTV